MNQRINLPPVRLYKTPAKYRRFADEWQAPSEQDRAKTELLRRCGIVALNHPAFQRNAEQVPHDPSSDKEVKRIAERLREVSRRLLAAGISVKGIAAPQIGESAAMFWMGDEKDGLIVANPAHRALGLRTTTFLQACLSLVGPFGAPKRPDRIEATWTDIDTGERRSAIAQNPVTVHGFLHESEHLLPRQKGSGHSGVFFGDQIYQHGGELYMVHTEHLPRMREINSREGSLDRWPTTYPRTQWLAATAGKFNILDYKELG